MSKSNSHSTIKPAITFSISKKEIAARKKLTKKVIGSFRLEGIEIDQSTLDKLRYFDTHGITAEDAIASLYDELNSKYGTNLTPPKD